MKKSKRKKNQQKYGPRFDTLQQLSIRKSLVAPDAGDGVFNDGALIPDNTKLGEYFGVEWRGAFGSHPDLVEKLKEGRVLCAEGGGQGGQEMGVPGIWIHGEGTLSFCNGATDKHPKFNAVFKVRKSEGTIWVDVLSYGEIHPSEEIIVDYGKAYWLGNLECRASTPCADQTPNPQKPQATHSTSNDDPQQTEQRRPNTKTANQGTGSKDKGLAPEGRGASPNTKHRGTGTSVHGQNSSPTATLVNLLGESVTLARGHTVRLLYPEATKDGKVQWPQAKTDDGDRHLVISSWIALGTPAKALARHSAPANIKAVFAPGVWRVESVNEKQATLVLDDPRVDQRVTGLSDVPSVTVPNVRCVPVESKWSCSAGWAEYCAGHQRRDSFRDRLVAWNFYSGKLSFSAWTETIDDDGRIVTVKDQSGGVSDTVQGLKHCFVVIAEASKDTTGQVSWRAVIVEAGAGNSATAQHASRCLGAHIQQAVPGAQVTIQHWMERTSIKKEYNRENPILQQAANFSHCYALISEGRNPGNMRCAFAAAKLLGAWASTGYLPLRAVERRNFDVGSTEDCWQMLVKLLEWLKRAKALRPSVRDRIGGLHDATAELQEQLTAFDPSQQPLISSDVLRLLASCVDNSFFTGNGGSQFSTIRAVQDTHSLQPFRRFWQSTLNAVHGGRLAIEDDVPCNGQKQVAWLIIWDNDDDVSAQGLPNSAGPGGKRPNPGRPQSGQSGRGKRRKKNW